MTSGQWPGGPARRLRIRVVTAATAAAICLAGCAAVAPSPSHAARAALDQTGPVAQPAAPSRPAAGSHAMALALARRMASGLELPRGWRQVSGRLIPGDLHAGQSEPADLDSVVVRRFAQLKQPLRAVVAFLSTHVPAGMRLLGISQDAPGPGRMERFSYAPRTRRRWAQYAELTVFAAAAVAGGTQLGAAAQVVWFPPRSRAEHLPLGGWRAVTVTALTPLRTGGSTRVTRVLTSPSRIAALAAFVNGLPGEPGVIMGCPTGEVTYRIAFLPGVTGRPRVLVTSDGCVGDPVEVAGVTQPALWDPGGRLGALAWSAHA